MTNSGVYISTAALRGRSLADMLDLLEARGLKRLELGLLEGPVDGLGALLREAREKRGFEFIIHNYFPPPARPFVLNPASIDPDHRARCLDLCRTAIDLSARLDAPFYSIHAGFTVRAEPGDLGGDLSRLPRIPRGQAETAMVETLRRLSDQAGDRLDILVENHVLIPANRVDGGNELLPGALPDELLGLLEAVDRENVGLLIDLGHLKVTAATMGQAPEAWFERLAPLTRAWHLHDNDGTADTHGPLDEAAWFWPLAGKAPAEKTALIIEAAGLSPENLVRQTELVERRWPRK